MTTVSFDEHIRAEYETAFPIPDDATPFELYVAGYHVGLKAGQTLAGSVIETISEQARSDGFDQGEAQGIAYCAYQASHVTTADINAAMTPADAAARMRERITNTLQAAAQMAKQRMEART